MVRLLLKLITFCIGLLVIGTVCANIWVYITAKPYIYTEISEVPKALVALVPGASVLDDGTLSPIFRDRVDMAIALYETQKVQKILVSGDDGTVEYNEVNPALEYLLSKNIPEADIYLDHAGFDTYSTMYRARDIFEVPSVIVVTQEFHLARSVFLARSLGIGAFGLKADVGTILFKNRVREFFATDKAVLDVVTDRLPKFLGTKIPVTEEPQNKTEEN